MSWELDYGGVGVLGLVKASNYMDQWKGEKEG